jgi:NADH:ubiquinone oxidoreductase subunit H
VIEAALALLWLGVVALAAGLDAAAERRGRLARVDWRPDLALPRREWGSDPDRPPAHQAWARWLAGWARAVRSSPRVGTSSHALRWAGRVGSLGAIATALSLIPFAGTWGGRAEGRALVVLDLEQGLLALIFLLLLAGLSQVAIGLSERRFWSRLGAVRMAVRTLASLAFFGLLLAALALGTGSLGLADLVAEQRGSFAPLASWASWAPGLERLRLPSWMLFRQPLTALLFVPALGLLLRRPLARDARAGTVGLAGFGLDDDPRGERAGRQEARLATVLGAALFVVVFLGAGAIPYVDSGRIVAGLAPFAGEVVPALVMVGVESGVFLAKMALVLAVAGRLRAATAAPREDQILGLIMRRLMPLAWANLLLLAALGQLGRSLGGEG